MIPPDLLEALRKAVQHNCHIADARHAADLGMCTYLLKMREYFRWERGLGFSDRLPADEIGDWLTLREDHWEGLLQSDFCDIAIEGERFDPFDADAINDRLEPLGLVYSGGLVGNGKPHFFLAHLESVLTPDPDMSIRVSNRELARGLSAPPAMTREQNIFLRREALRRYLWERMEIWRWQSPRNALAKAFASYDFAGDLEGALDGMSDAQKKATLLQLGFSDKSISYIQTMLGTSDAIRTYEKQLRQAAGTTKEVADKQMTPFQKGWAKLSAAFVDAGATLMDILGPAMGAAAAGLAWVMDGLKKLLGWLRDLYKRFEGPIKSFGKMLAIGTALIALVPAIGMLGGALATAFTVATGPVGLFIAAATAIGYLFVELVGEGETFGQKMESVFGKVRGWVDDAAFGFRNFGALAQLAVIEIVALALEWFPQMERPIERVVAFFVGAFAGLKAFFSSIVQNIIGGFQEIANVGKAVVAGLQAAWDSIKVGDLSGAVEAFTGAFQKELASQKDVIAPNAFAEFGKAYEEAARGVRQRFAADGGLRGTLDSERERLTRAIAEREAARAAVDAAQPPGGATMGSGAGEDGDGKKGDGRQPATRVEYVAAQGHRTADAYSTILAATAGRQKPMQEVAKETKRAADESEKQTGYLRTMSGMSITEVSLD